MTPPAIKISDVTVEFHAPKYGYSTFKEYALNRIRGRTGHTTFKALNQISLQVEQGQSVALIGHNGSGKSTLLRVLAGIYQPPGAEISVRGRVAPMIELGAGFDGELTGRENVILSCSIMGLEEHEAFERLPTIIEFSELGDFIDMPFKNYSSGMQARLGFACVAAVDPDILLIDEVLAVGDSNFARKCLARIRELQARGTTLILVSHDAATVSAFCTHGFVFEAGCLVFNGPVQEALDVHEHIMARRENRVLSSVHLEEIRRQRLLVADEHLRSTGLAISETPEVEVSLQIDQEGQTHLHSINLQQPFQLRFHAKASGSRFFQEHVSFGIGIMTESGTRVAGLNNLQKKIPIPLETLRSANSFSILFNFHAGLPDLAGGVYKILFGIHDQNISRSVHLKEFGPYLLNNRQDGLGSRGDILRLLEKDIGVQFEILE